MSAAKALEIGQLPQHSRRAVAVANALYRSPARRLGDWLWQFERRPLRVVCCAEVALEAPESSRTLLVELATSARDPQWWCYQGEVRNLAFVAAHAPLFDFLDEIFEGAPSLLTLHDASADQAPAITADACVGFSLCNSASAVHCHGRLHFATDALAPDTPGGLRHAPHDWSGVPARVALEWQGLRLSPDEAAGIRPGCVVRLDAAPEFVLARLGERTLRLRGCGNRWRVDNIS